MIKRDVALRYAKGLFDLDIAKESLEKRLRDFELIQALIEEHPKLLTFLKAPQIDLAEKGKMLKSSLTNQCDTTFVHFLIYLIGEGRLGYLTQIALEYRLFVDKYLEIWEAKIITAVPIEPQTEEKLRKKLESFYHKKIKIEKEINPQIIGGAVLVVANEMIDWSIAERLKKIKERLLNTPKI